MGDPGMGDPDGSDAPAPVAVRGTRLGLDPPMQPIDEFVSLEPSGSDTRTARTHRGVSAESKGSRVSARLLPERP